MQVWLRLDEMCLEFIPVILRLQFYAPDLAVFLKLACLRDEAICDAHDLNFSDRLVWYGYLVYALVDPRIEALERLIGADGLPNILVICRKVRGWYPGIVSIEMDE